MEDKVKSRPRDSHDFRLAPSLSVPDDAGPQKQPAGSPPTHRRIRPRSLPNIDEKGLFTRLSPFGCVLTSAVSPSSSQCLQPHRLLVINTQSLILSYRSFRASPQTHFALVLNPRLRTTEYPCICYPEKPRGHIHFNWFNSFLAATQKYKANLFRPLRCFGPLPSTTQTYQARLTSRKGERASCTI